MKESKMVPDLKERMLQNLRTWNNDQRLSFIEFFAHELTICIRLIWSRAETGNTEKIEQIKWINEILHRLPMFAHTLRTGSGDWESTDIPQVVENCINQAPGLRELVTYAVIHSIEQITGRY